MKGMRAHGHQEGRAVRNEAARSSLFQQTADAGCPHPKAGYPDLPVAPQPIPSFVLNGLAHLHYCCTAHPRATFPYCLRLLTLGCRDLRGGLLCRCSKGTTVDLFAPLSCPPAGF